MKKIYLLIAISCISILAYGQVNTYTFAYSSETYTPLSTSTALTPNAAISGNGWFEQNYNLAIPFVFYFNGVGYSNVYVNSNGYLTFGKHAGPNNPRPFVLNEGQNGSICAMANATTYSWTGMTPVGLLGSLVDFANANPIRYGVTGTAPNRAFIVQWTNSQRTVSYYGSGGTAVESVTFQIRLNETSNIAQIVYDNSTTNQTNTYYPSVGLCGASTSDIFFLTGSSWASPSYSTVSVGNIAFSSSTSISSGTTYKFSPPVGLMPGACSSAPSNVLATATNAVTCGSVGLGLSNLPLSTGLTFQWQSSKTGVPNSWANITGATDPSYIVTPTASTFYQCLIACGTGTPVASGTVVVGKQSCPSAPPNYSFNVMGGFPYCTISQFSIAGGACGSVLNDNNNAFSNFNFTAYASSGGIDYSYIDNTFQQTHIKLQGSTSASSTFTATLTGNSLNTGVYGVWIDLNDNGIFTDAGEYVGSVAGVASTPTTFTLTIPANTFGVHRLRVVGALNGSYTTSTISPTGSNSLYGQAIDYTVEVIPPTPAPTNNSPVCVGGTFLLNGPTMPAGAIYTWTGPGSYYATTTSVSQSFVATSPAAAGTYSLITTSNGASSCAAGTTTVVVNPVPSLTAASNNSPLCPGATLTLAASGPSNVTGYSWSGPVGITGATSATASVPGASLAAGGVYSVTVNNGTGSGCAVTYTTNATVLPLPTLTGASSNTPVCSGNTLSLSVTGPLNVTGYLWSGPVPITSPASATATVPGANAAAAGVYTVTVNNGSGPGCTARYTTTVNVNPSPAPIGGIINLCPGASTGLFDAGGGTWGSSSLSVATINSGTGVVSAISSGVTTITYTLPGGCYITSPLTVNSNPAPITGVSNICVGTTGSLSSFTPGGTWSSSVSAIASVNSASGLVTGVSGGIATISYTLGTGCSTTTPINIFDAPVAYFVTGGGGFCEGAAGVHIGLSYSNAGVSYRLYRGATLVSTMPGASSGLDFGVFTTPGIYSMIGENTLTSCTSNMVGAVTVSVNPLPNSTYVVSGGGNYCSGGSGVPVSLSGSDVGISYQLYNGTAFASSPMAGIGGPLSFGMQTTGGVYTVVATDMTSGCVANMPGSAIVTVNPPPTVYTLSGGGSFCLGGTGVHITLNGSDLGTNYQLYRDGLPEGGTKSGTGSSIDFGLLTAVGLYNVVATNTLNTCTGNMAGSPTITIAPLPIKYTVTGGGAFCAGGAGVHVGLSYSDPGFSYQLFKDNVSLGSPMIGAAAALDFGLQTASGTYKVIATNTVTGCNDVMSGTVDITTYSTLITHPVTGGGGYCPGSGGVHIGLGSSTNGIKYQLFYGGTPVSGLITSTGGPLDFGLYTAIGTYTAMGFNTTTGCSNSMSGSASISFTTLPAPYSVLAGGTGFCAGGTGIDITLSNSETNTSYQLYRSSSMVGLPQTGTGAALDFGSQTIAGVYTILATSTITGCVGNMTGSAVVVVNPLPVVFTVTGGGSFCDGGSGIRVGLSGSNPGISYQLYHGGPIGPVVTGTGLAIDFGYQTLPGAYTVVATNDATSCTKNMAGSAVVIMNDVPLMHAMTGGGNFCAGGAGMPVGLDGSDAGLHYQLFNGTTGGVVYTGTGGALNFGLHTVAGVYTVVATNTGTGCSSNMSGTTVIGINPLPAAYSVIGGGTYCSDGLGISVGLSNSDSGTNYQLYHSGSPLGGLWPGTGAPIDFGLQTLTGGYTVVATDTATSCTNPMTGSATVSVSTRPRVDTVTGGGNYCSGGTGVPVGLNRSVSGIVYQLYKDGLAAGGGLPGTGGALNFGLQTLPGMYTVIADAGGICPTPMSHDAKVVVNALPAVHTITGGGVYCEGTSGVHIGLDGSGTGIKYQLYHGAAIVGSPMTGTGGVLDFGLQIDGGAYSIVATDTTTGCVKNMAGSGSVYVSVGALPHAFTVIGGGHYCSGDTGVVVRLNGSNTNINYQLYRGGAAVGSYIPGSGTYLDFGTFAITGNYTILATDASTTCTKVMDDTAVIVIDPILTPSVTVTLSPSGVITKGQKVTATANATNAGTPIYQWILNGVPIGGANGQSYISSYFANNDSLTCEVTSDGPCGGITRSRSVILTVAGNVGVQTVTPGMEVMLVPNPNNGLFTLKGTMGRSIDEEVNIEVTDMVGHTIYKDRIMALNGVINSTVQLGNVANGMYLVNLKSEAENKVFHMVIAR